MASSEPVADYILAVSNLTDVQKKLVKQMGLWTFASTVRPYKFDHSFSRWLLARIDHRNQFMVESRAAYIIGPDDVSKIFGLPNNGNSVINSVSDKSFTTKQLIRNRLHAKEADERWAHAAARVISANLDPDDREACDSFITAFAVYTLPLLLGHGDSDDTEVLNYVLALKTPADFSKFNWADFLYHEIILESMKSRCARRAEDCFKPAFGATLFAHLDASPAYLRDDTVVSGATMPPRSRCAPEVEVPEPDLPWHIGELLVSREGAEVTFDVDGEAFAAHGFILAARSPVFEAEIYGPATRETDTRRITVPDMRPAVFRALLHFIYTDSLPAMGDLGSDEMRDLVGDLLAAADRYTMDRLKVVCEHILARALRLESVASILVLADRHRCNRLRDACIHFIAHSDEMGDDAAKGIEEDR
ncbi:TRAF transcription factor [Panicum miliaceum]|uniref:TRAF transcription factor n=1 Tax=Panicum miliaceum TaxID=4540 RepID=A0A3L6RJZ8_PANMI|nr:TRAF transcription factor [Panicum miliaceum]